MRFTSRIKPQSGFTLIEVLIIAPIVILAIGGFVGLMVTMIGEVLVTRDQSALTYETQSSLDRIEQDVRLSTQFLVTTGTQTAPQGSDSNFTGTAAFTNGANSLLLSALATDKNPTDVSRWLVYLANQPNPCGAEQRYNRVLLTKVIYFVKSGSLWRRTVVPDWNTNSAATADANTVCSAPWQQNSCSPGYSATRCKAEDEKIMDNVTSMDVKYYNASGDTTDVGAANATSAGTVDVTINSQKTVAGGNVITDASNVRVSKLNDIDTTQLPPSTPVLTSSLSSPNSVQFSWQPVSTATSYQLGYKINSGEWVTQIVDTGTTDYTVNGNRNDTIQFRVASFNNAGSSAYATTSATIPEWFDVQMNTDIATGWTKYSDSYNLPSFSKSSSGRVFLKGLVKGRSATSPTINNVIGTLPEGYRPEGTLVFQVLTSPNTEARVDIKSNGDIIFNSGTGTWISLDSISFLPADSPYTWKPVQPTNYKNGWSNWGGAYEPVRATADNLGRVNIQGLAKAGTTTVNTTMIALQELSTSYIPPKSLHFPAGGSGMSLFWIWSDGDLAKRGAQTSSYMGLQALYYPGSTGTWSTITPVSPWVNYSIPSGSYPILQCTKGSDNVVTIRGLIKSGSVTSGTLLATLPPACPAPDVQSVMTTTSYDDIGRVDIMPNGQLLLRLGNTNWFALNLSYIVD